VPGDPARWTEADLEAHMARMKGGATEPLPKKREKYGRVKKEVDGHVFDSSLEARAYQVLRLMEQTGEIKGLELQPHFTLQEKQLGMRSIEYVADFRFFRFLNIPIRPANREVIVDVKGFKTPVFRLKEKLFRAKFPDLCLEIWDKAKVKEMGG
jgi:hypothetical protein